ncbi:MAG: hypothetical protein U0264_01660 [Candidatus Kapaibacterium sp.]
MEGFSPTYPGFPITAAMVISGVFAPARLATGTPSNVTVLYGDGVWRIPPVAGDALTSNPLSQFAPTTSAQVASIITDETGSGALVFANSPTLVTPVLGVATATSINKVTITAPGTGATLTLANNSVFRTIGNDVVTLTSTADTNLTLPESGFLMVGANNLSELDDPAVARTNIGLSNTIFSGTLNLGSATSGTNNATLNFGTSTGNNSGTLNIGTASAGNNSRIINIGTASGTNTSQVNIGGTLNKYTLTAPATGATITLADNSTFQTAGNFTTVGANNLTLTTTGSTNVTFPTDGLLLSASNNLSDVLSAGTSRVNLGFEDATYSSSLNVGTATGGINSGTLNFGAATGNNSATLNIGTSSTGSNTNSAIINIGTGNSTISSVINIGASVSNVGSSNVHLGFTTFRGGGFKILGGLSGTDEVTLRLPTIGITTPFELILPISQGSAGSTFMNDGNGNLTWSPLLPSNVTSDGANFTAMAVVGTTNINASGTAATNIGTGASAGTLTIGRVSGITDFKSDITISGSTSGAVTLKAAPTTTPFNLTLPSSQSSGLRAPLYSDPSGNLSWGLTVSVPYSVKDSASMSGSGVNNIARTSTGFVYIAGTTNVVIFNGTTYSTVAHGLVAPIYSLDANSTDSVVMVNNTSTWRRSTDGGQTWGNITAPSSLSWNGVRSGGANGGSTVWCAIVLNPTGGQGAISTDNGATWSAKAITGAGVGANGLCNDGGTSGATEWLATMLSSSTTRISTDNGATWVAGNSLSNNCLGCIYLNGKFIAWDTANYIYTATSVGSAWTTVKAPSSSVIHSFTYFKSKWYVMILEGDQRLYSCTDITAPIWIREMSVCPNAPPYAFVEYNSELYLATGTSGTGIFKIS